MVRGLTLQDGIKGRRVPGFGDILTTQLLNGTETQEILSIANPGRKIAWQCNGSLTCNVEVSINGTDFVATGTGAVASISFFDTHPVRFIRVTRTGGEGKLILVTE
jgi:hypothetical protein